MQIILHAKTVGGRGGVMNAEMTKEVVMIDVLFVTLFVMNIVDVILNV